MKQKPDLKFWGLWNLSFGFLGVQIAYTLQSANVTRVVSTIGAAPSSLSIYWILPPLMMVFGGMYLIIGAIAVFGISKK